MSDKVERARQFLFVNVFNREIRQDELDTVVPMFIDPARHDEFYAWLSQSGFRMLPDGRVTRRQGVLEREWNRLPLWKAYVIAYIVRPIREWWWTLFPKRGGGLYE